MCSPVWAHTPLPVKPCGGSCGLTNASLVDNFWRYTILATNYRSGVQVISSNLVSTGQLRGVTTSALSQFVKAPGRSTRRFGSMLDGQPYVFRWGYRMTDQSNKPPASLPSPHRVENDEKHLRNSPRVIRVTSLFNYSNTRLYHRLVHLNQ